MTNFEKLKNMTQEQIAAEFMIFRPSDACFDDENRNYYALDGSWHQYSQDCFRANVKWLNEEIPKDPQDYIKELEAELYHLRHERDQAVEDLYYIAKKIHECDIKLSGDEDQVNYLNLGRCADELMEKYHKTPVWDSWIEINNAPTIDAVPVVRCKDCMFRCEPIEFGELYCPILNGSMNNDDFCSYGERKEKKHVC